MNLTSNARWSSPTYFRRTFRMSFALVGLLLLTGCGQSTIVVESEIEPTQERLMAIGRAYFRYLGDYQRAPTSEKQLEPILKEEGTPKELLVSPRDNQPFVICYGVNDPWNEKWGQGLGVLAYEATSQEGKRYVLSTMQSVELVSDEEFNSALFPPGYRPKK